MEQAPIAAGPLEASVGRRVLDPCCGSRMMWFDRQHPDAVFGDKRTERHVLCDGRTLRIEPDVLLDFTDLPYPDGAFNLVVFDPPHLHTAGPKSWMAAKYGKLTGDWREELRKGFSECFRVLASNGTLIFKWNETQVKVREVLALTPVQPLFGHPTGRKGLTHWMVFMSPNATYPTHPSDKPAPTTGDGAAIRVHRKRDITALCDAVEAARAAALEEAAEIADAHATCEGIAQRIAADIRALKDGE